MAAIIQYDITNDGRDLIAKGMAGKEIKFTRIGIGDGNLAIGQDLKTMTQLVNEILSLGISSIALLGDGKVEVSGAFSSADLQVGFYYREVGLFAEDPDTHAELLFCCGNAGQNAEWIPPSGSATSIEKAIRLITTVATTANVTAVIASGTYLTVADKGVPGGVAPIGQDGKIPPEFYDAGSDLPVYINGECIRIGPGTGDADTENATSLTALGYNAGGKIVPPDAGGSNSVIIGTNAGKELTTGKGNVIIGADACNSEFATDFSGGVFIGHEAGRDALAYNQAPAICVGKEAGARTQLLNDIFIGTGAGGASEGNRLQSNGENIGIGTKAMSSIAGAGECIGIGRQSFESLKMGGSSVAVGVDAGKGLNSSMNSIIIGEMALSSIDEDVWGIVIGSRSLIMSDAENSSTNACIVIGSNVNYYVDDTPINNLSRCTIIGTNARTSGNDQVQIGSHGQEVYGSSSWNTRSDARDKRDITVVREHYNYRDFIMGIEPSVFRKDPREAYSSVTYITGAEYATLSAEEKKPWRLSQESRELLQDDNLFDIPTDELDAQLFYERSFNAPSDGSKAGKRFHNGFIAQKVKQVADEVGFDFAGYQDHSVNGGCDVFTLAYEEFHAPHIALTQDHDREIRELQEAVKTLQKELATLKAKK